MQTETAWWDGGDGRAGRVSKLFRAVINAGSERKLGPACRQTNGRATSTACCTPAPMSDGTDLVWSSWWSRGELAQRVTPQQLAEPSTQQFDEVADPACVDRIGGSRPKERQKQRQASSRNRPKRAARLEAKSGREERAERRQRRQSQTQAETAEERDSDERRTRSGESREGEEEEKRVEGEADKPSFYDDRGDAAQKTR